jgi:hypothetical protein
MCYLSGTSVLTFTCSIERMELETDRPYPRLGAIGRE